MNTSHGSLSKIKVVREPRDSFVACYTTICTVILALLEEADNLSKDEIPPHFEKISSECQTLQKLVSDSIVFLSGYDKRTSQEVKLCVIKKNMS